MRTLHCFIALLTITSCFHAQNLEVDGILHVEDSISIGTSSPLDQLYLYNSGADPSFTLHKKQSLLGGTVNYYGRIWQNSSLNLALNRTSLGSEINIHDDFLRLKGKILLSPYDACDLNGIQDVRIVVERGIRPICLDTGMVDPCNMDCAEDIINFYPEQPFDGDYQSNLGIFSNPWNRLYVDLVNVNSLEGIGQRNVEVTNDGRLVAGPSVVKNEVYTVQPNDFSSAFYVPFHEFTSSYFIGGNHAESNVNSYTAPVHLPQGATIDSIKFTYRDNSTTESLFMLMGVSSTQPSSGTIDEYSFSADMPPTCGLQCSTLLDVNRVVNNGLENYFIFVRPTDLTWDTANEDVAFGSAIVYYHY